MNDYDRMLERLWAYRKALGLSQEQMCAVLGISQEQYSYLENGFVKLTDENLKAFCRIGIDVDHLLTGNRYDFKAEDLNTALDSLDGKYRDFTIKIAAEIIIEKAARGSMGEISEINLKNLKLLSAALQTWEDFSMVNFVREDQGCTQMDMVQRLGIGIRKYRALEREEIYPDAELHLNFYRMSGYPPSMFMNIRDRRLMAVNMLWSELCHKERLDMISFIKSLDGLV